MFSRVCTFAIDGLAPRGVSVEVDIQNGLPAFTIVGLGDAAVRESRERVRTAIVNSGLEFPGRRITANLAPASVRKGGPGFDLALAVGVLAASGQVPSDRLARCAVIGELGLDGSVRGCPGVLTAAEGALRARMPTVVVPRDRIGEASLVEGIEVVGVAALRELSDYLLGADPPAVAPARSRPRAGSGLDLADIRGEQAAVEALAVAAAGGHNLLLTGPPGSGKTMLARRLPTILPPMAHDEALTATRIHSIAGLHDGSGLLAERPFRAPHHTIAAAGLIGGGNPPAPGEATLAHHGVLFLDELSEFARPSLECLRQPLEDGRVTIVRGQRSVTFPTACMLIAATNPCPCGWGEGDERCRCAEPDHARHRRRLSGPLLDRIDLVVTVRRPTGDLLGEPAGSDSATVADRVLAARERQAARLGEPATACNGRLDGRALRRHARLSEGARSLLGSVYDSGRLTARGHDRVLRIAMTLADLDGVEQIEEDHLLRAVALRSAPEGPA